jgi:hypothetical protein
VKGIIGMECSGRLREALRRLGHDVWSCDYKAADDGSPYHIQGSVFDHDVVNAGWDFGFFHPDCTWVAGSGARHMTVPYRMCLAEMTIWICKAIWSFPIPRVGVESSVGILSRRWMKSTQTIHPWWFGQKKLKPTSIWLRGFDKLVPTNLIRPPKVKDMTKEERKEWCEIHLDSPGRKNGKSRGDRRSVLFQGIADGLAAHIDAQLAAERQNLSLVSPTATNHVHNSGLIAV